MTIYTTKIKIKMCIYSPVIEGKEKRLGRDELLPPVLSKRPLGEKKKKNGGPNRGFCLGQRGLLDKAGRVYQRCKFIILPRMKKR